MRAGSSLAGNDSFAFENVIVKPERTDVLSSNIPRDLDEFVV
jgi:hypothetical protein